MFVVFEGLDKTGKTTLEWELLKATNFKHMVIDRGPMGYMTFDKIFGRSTKKSDHDFIHYARKVSKSGDFLIVHCVVDTKTAQERLKAHNETCPYDYDEARKLYRANVRRFYNMKNVLEINTATHSIEECVKLIIEKIQEVQRSEL